MHSIRLRINGRVVGGAHTSESIARQLKLSMISVLKVARVLSCVLSYPANKIHVNN